MPHADTRFDALLDAAVSLVEDIAASTSAPDVVRIRDRLLHSVIRPLRAASGSPGSYGSPDPSAPPAHVGEPSSEGRPLSPDERVWGLARAATELAAAQPDRPELIEAAAALQDLVATPTATAAAAATDGSATAERLAELGRSLEGLSPQILVSKDGPYLITKPVAWDWLGQSLPARPMMALCRCGASAIKPLCDGTHATNGFTDAKVPDRVPDSQDTFVGLQVTVLDNRGVCQHSGLCTDRLATVFHQGSEPFVTPSGGRLDEIIRAVRDCPSGALSYAVDGVEARADVDHHDIRPPGIDVTRDGPYRVTGALPVLDAAGVPVARNTGASHEHFALCRCGHSQNKPFCSGMHWYVDFHDPVPPAEHEPTIFEWAGGLRALERMTRLFYEKHVPEDPLLAPLFASMSPDHPQRVAKWHGEVFCGPTDYSSEYGGYTRMLSQHVGKGLTEEQRARWVTLLLRSALEAGLPNDAEFRSAFGAYIEWGSRLAVENSQSDARPPEHMPMPHWDWHTSAGPPGARISATSAPATDDAEVVLPGADEAVGYSAHIKSMFRARDRQSMSFVFDLWSYDDVVTHAAAILERLGNGSMPCDGPWPADKIDVFRRWTTTGTPE